MSATWRCSAAYYAWDGYYSDEYSDDDYTDQDDYTDYDDSGSEYDDERSEDSISSPISRAQWYNNLDNMQRGSYGVNRRTNNRAASMPPISYGRASSEREKSTSPRKRRAATCEPRLLFAPSPGAKSSVAKGREFEDYFTMGVEKARGNITAKVEFQKKLNITPGWCSHMYYIVTHCST